MVDEREDVGAETDPTQAGEGAIDGAESLSSEVTIEALQQELAQEKEKAEKYLDNWRRAQADFVNYRRRIDQQRSEEAKYASALTIMNVLPVLDDMERAFQSVPPSLLGLTWVSGMQLIYRKLLMSLEVSGVNEIKAEGEPFDPNLHEAVMHSDGEEGKVVTVFQKGYKLHDRVVRPAMVAVGNGTKSATAETKEQEG